MKNKTYKYLVGFLLGSILIACSSLPKTVNHGFEFHADWDSPNVEILDFKYGNSKMPGATNPEWVRETGKSFQATNTNGPMLVGDFLYVKWRLKNSQEVIEDNVDLRGRLPTDMKNKKVYFVVDGMNLKIFLILPEHLPEGATPNNLRLYKYQKVVSIYP